MAEPAEITAILEKLEAGDRAAVDQLFAMVYAPLRRMAQKQLGGERPDHTLNATALVHEAYIKLVDQRSVSWQNRAHFYAVAARAMRRILIDYARARLADKRGGGEPLVTFDDEAMSGDAGAADLLAIDEALNQLFSIDERQAQVVEYKFFGGLTHEEIAGVLDLSVQTVHRDWRFARAWLSRQLKEE